MKAEVSVEKLISCHALSTLIKQFFIWYNNWYDHNTLYMNLKWIFMDLDYKWSFNMNNKMSWMRVSSKLNMLIYLRIHTKILKIINVKLIIFIK